MNFFAEGDWEEDHTRFAEVTENSRVYRNSFNSERDDEDLDLEASLSQLVLDEGEGDEDEEDDVDDGDENLKHKTSQPIVCTSKQIFGPLLCINCLYLHVELLSEHTRSVLNGLWGLQLLTSMEYY